MFSNLRTKISRLINKAPLKRKEKGHTSQIDYKFKHLEEAPKKINIKRGIIVIIFLIFIIIFVFIIHITLSIISFSPKAFPESTPRDNNEIEDKRVKTVLLIVLDRTDQSHSFVDGLSIYSYNFDTKKTAIFTINPDLKIYSTRMGKDMYLRTAFNDISPSNQKMNYFTEGVESLLAIKIDNYIVTDLVTFNSFSKYFAPININVNQEIKDSDVSNLPDKQSKQWNKGNVLLKGDDYLEFLASNNNGRDDLLDRQASVLKKMALNVFNLQNIVNSPDIINTMKNGYFYTDLTKEDIFKLVYEALQYKDTNINYGYTKSKSYTSVYSISYYPVYSLIFNIIDQDISDVLSDILIFKEQARIEILNGSSVKGLASNRARWISNTGARIIKVGNSYESEKTTKIYCEDCTKYPKTISAIQRIFDGKALLINKDYPQRHVGDIIVVIGDEY